jgi:diadenosine tetraphosphate (Ap4A) HIT family hydrolase
MLMFDRRDWEMRVAGAGCSVCSPTFAATDQGRVALLPSGPAVLQDDAAFRGYCILYFRRHVVELTELTAAERHILADDLARLAAAVQACCRPTKLNYASLGNEVPHLHWHVIPRYPDDGWWGRPIWLRPACEKRPLPPAEYAHLRDQLRRVLETS